MQLIVNGEVRESSETATIAAYLSQLNLRSQMVVVEHNGVIVARERYGETALKEGDVLEIVQMMAGG